MPAIDLPCLNPMQPGTLHRDNIVRFWFRYFPVARANQREAKTASVNGPPQQEEVVAGPSDSRHANSRAVLTPRSRQFWWSRLPARTLAVTIDDGPHPDGTPAVLDVLDQHNVRAAFFMLGIAACAHPELAIQVHDAGHIVGYHGWAHTPETSAEAFAALDRTIRTVEMAAGVSPDAECADQGSLGSPTCRSAPGSNPRPSGPLMQRLVRYPYGYDQHWHAPPKRHPAKVGIGWTIDSLDTIRLPQRARLKRMLRQFYQNSSHGHVVLMHDGGRGGKRTAILLDKLLTDMKANGWRTVLLTDFLEPALVSNGATHWQSNALPSRNGESTR